MSWLTRTLSALGLRAEQPAIAELASGGARPKVGTSVVPNLSLWQQFTRFGGGLSPTDVSTFIRRADSGDMVGLIELAQEARQKDGHLQGCLQQYEESISSLDWSLDLPEGAKAGEKRAAKWVEQVLRDSDELQDLIAHMSGAVYLVYAVSEIVWKLSGGRLVPATIKNIDQRRFGFRESDGAFVMRDPNAVNDGVEFQKAFPNRFIVCQPRVTGDVPCREGLARVIIWAALFRNWTITDWLKLGEIAWKPWRIGTYKKEAKTEDIEGLVDVLDGMSASGVAKVPESIGIDVKWAPNSTNKPMHEALYETVAREMSKAILGQTETVQSSQTSGYAQASVMNGVRKELRDARAKKVAQSITEGLIRPMVALNFGANVRPPVFYFNTQETADIASFSNGVEKLVKAGAKVPQAWVRDEVGIPEPKEGEEILDPSASLNANDAAPAEQTPPAA